MVALTPTNLLLDSAIRNFVLIPIFLLTFMVSIIRSQFMMWFQQPKNDTNLLNTYNGQLFVRTRTLLQGGSRISPEAFERRKAFFAHPTTGILKPKTAPPTDKVDLGMPLLMDPSNMGGMMSGQMTMIFQNVYMIGLYNTIDYFFSGFVAAKLPLSLTGGFKGMLHAGIALYDLEMSYVSSSSWYLLIFSGMTQLINVILQSTPNPYAVVGGYAFGAGERVYPKMPGGSGFSRSEPHDLFDKEMKTVAGASHVDVLSRSLERFVNLEKAAADGSLSDKCGMGMSSGGSGDSCCGGNGGHGHSH
eukprot:TRINITY_DN6060_c0_g1_i1.p1 TRINITY_DN6060_c0_g1~~TRINITY_DN6060_c0_g1_i1.p1  ORF type:complete len:316 (+),score=72.44 TRINITY_DN6060_c0_g1_i1:42-950(+)